MTTEAEVVAQPNSGKHLPLATYEEIIAKNDIGEDTVEVPEWGLAVRVRGLSRGVLIEIQSDRVDTRAADILGLHHGLVEPQVSKEQAESLLEKSGTATGRILGRILELSGIPQSASVPEAARDQGTFRPS